MKKGGKMVLPPFFIFPISYFIIHTCPIVGRGRPTHGSKYSLNNRQLFGCLFSYLIMDKVFKALADRTRRKLLDRLFAKNGQTLSELCAAMKMTRQAVTKHLKLLEAANLVSTVRKGREKFHYLNPVPINEISERWINKYEMDRVQALADLKRGIEEHK